MVKKYVSLNKLSIFLDKLRPMLIPSGAIIIWFGDSTSIPIGWHLCDGTKGTPDLRNKFVLGAGNSYSVGDIGGEKEHTLTIDEMPAHTHSFINAFTNRDIPTEQVGIFDIPITDGTPPSGEWIPSTTNSTGESIAHNNMPPYYALCYIMKL